MLSSVFVHEVNEKSMRSLMRSQLSLLVILLVISRQIQRATNGLLLSHHRLRGSLAAKITVSGM
jgi:hypothetical protein